ncbi:TRM11 family SAM-dependent methyltransferase [Candidatus Clostridium stratigraminis]|uniref:TRM11 family SAM-dependent methyltransferase n=1 Tax=Candidatus Clostridium stratigraminis TaxID=3381661 RepID=A0ABW8T6I2_9CLOT
MNDIENLEAAELSYFYIINYTAAEKELCMMEMKYLFNIIPLNKHFFSFHYVIPSRSAFIKQCISIIYSCGSLEELIEQILEDNFSSENFKVRYINFEENNISYEQRRRIEYNIGYKINGEADVHEPEVVFGVVNINGKWIFGVLEDNKNTWDKHNHKLYSYSNALNVRVARALVNIASGNNKNLRLVDPCCGIGTVVIEALSMGLNIRGYELNPMIADNAKRNLDFFGYEDVITNGDMHEIKDKYDAAIVDLPYGVFTPVTLKQQLDIIKSARKIAHKAILITFENMEHYFEEAGFKIVDRCIIAKGTFIRYITVCK